MGEEGYLENVDRILTEGIRTKNRTTCDTLVLSGLTHRYNLRGWKSAIMTSKKLFTRGVIEELLWILRGSTDASELQKVNVHIWDVHSSREFLDKRGLVDLPTGDIGAGYGFRLRYWGATYEDCQTDYSCAGGFDQLSEVVRLLMEDRGSRRIHWTFVDPILDMVTALPPCHELYEFQVLDDTLNLVMFQRSADVAVGVPFNLASCSFLVFILCHVTGLKPGTLTHVMGNAHIYIVHEDGMYKQLQRYRDTPRLPEPPAVYITRPPPSPEATVEERVRYIEELSASDFHIEPYESWDKIPFSVIE